MTQLHVRTARSNDGTRIAFERTGDGPPLILVVGAFNDRHTGEPLGRFLEPHFRVFNYDRRGRGARGDAVEYFQRLVGIPDEIIIQMRNAPFRPALEEMAHTLVYEMTIIGDAALPTDIAVSVSTPTLVMDGGNSPAWIRHAARSVADAVPHGVYHSLEGQTHDLVPEAIGPVVREFLGG